MSKNVNQKHGKANTSKIISARRLNELNRGLCETTVLAENLAVDFALLMEAVLPQLGQEVIDEMRLHQSEGIVKRMGLAAALIEGALGYEKSVDFLQTHGSDTVRGWGCYMVGQWPGLALDIRLKKIRGFADDRHFGVREWAWLAVRPALVAELPQAISLLEEWARHSSVNIRRFSCEAIRPRGVWCTHIKALKDCPEQALPILELLKNDKSRYVQDSVSNWLNDAAKSQPEWVNGVCERWLAQAGNFPNLTRVCKRALRSIST